MILLALYIAKQKCSVGSIAVDCFFVCSGYLITASYFKNKSFKIFLWHRFLRLMPGYWIAILFDSLIITFFFGEIWNLEYLLENLLTPLNSIFYLFENFNEWMGSQVFSFEYTAFFFKGKTIIVPLFVHNPFPNFINGSLWTLPYEVKCYLIIAILGFLGFLNKKIILRLFFICLIISFFVFYKHLLNIKGNDYLFLYKFLIGSIFYFYNFSLNWQISLMFFITGTISLFFGFYLLISPFVTVYIFFLLATILPFKKIFRQRDYSYGVYIYSFPVQQTLSAYHLNQFPHWVYFILSICFTLPLAILSWHFIEKPSLKLKNLFGKTI